MSTWVVACCSTTATRRATALRPSVSRGFPSSRTTPDDVGRTPASRRSSVDFPEPLGPSSPTVSPARGSRLTPSTIILPSAVHETFSAFSPTPPPPARSRPLASPVEDDREGGHPDQ